MKTLTIRQHLNDGLPISASAKAINNTPPERLEIKTTCFNHALREAFNWHDTPEKFEYWAQYLK